MMIYQEKHVDRAKACAFFSIAEGTLYKLFSQGLPKHKGKGIVKVDLKKAIEWLLEKQAWRKKPKKVVKFITVKECCNRFNISKATLYRILKQGELRKWKIGRATRLDIFNAHLAITKHKQRIKQRRRKKSSC
jgi:excisionase family DNA binding protein